MIIERLAEPIDDNKSVFSSSEIRFYIEQLEKMKSELNVTRGEKRLLLERLEKERQNIPDNLRDAIENENKYLPEFADINRLYAFSTSIAIITAGYLLHGIRKEYTKGGSHIIATICHLDNKDDELALLMEATLTRFSSIQKNNNDLPHL